MKATRATKRSLEKCRNRSPPCSPTPDWNEEEELKKDIEERLFQILLQQILQRLGGLAEKRTQMYFEIIMIYQSVRKLQCQWKSEYIEIRKVKSTERDAYYDERAKETDLLAEKRLEERKRKEAEDRKKEKNDKSREFWDERKQRDKKKRLKKTCGGNKIGPAVGSNGIGTRRQSSAVNRNDSDMDISDEEHDRIVVPIVPPPYRYSPIVSLTIPSSYRPSNLAPAFQPSSSSGLDLGHEHRRRSRSRSADGNGNHVDL